MGYRVLSNAFVAGEIAPQLEGRTDDSGYKAGASKLLNFIVLPQGSVRARAGLEYVTRVDAPKVKLIPFRFASDETLVLVFTNKKMRILTHGREVVNSDGTVYEVDSPFFDDTFDTLHYSQNADVITLTSNKTKSYELIRYDATDWRFSEVNVLADVDPPTDISLERVDANTLTSAERAELTKLTATYVITAISDKGKESLPSQALSIQCNYYINGCKVRIKWNAPNDKVRRFKVYRLSAGLYGFIGELSSKSPYGSYDYCIEDEGNNPDMSVTPPKYKQPFQDETIEENTLVIENGGSGYYYGYDSTQKLYAPQTLYLDIEPFGFSYSGEEVEEGTFAVSKCTLSVYQNGESILDKVVSSKLEFVSDGKYKITIPKQYITVTNGEIRGEFTLKLVPEIYNQNEDKITSNLDGAEFSYKGITEQLSKGMNITDYLDNVQQIDCVAIIPIQAVSGNSVIYVNGKATNGKLYYIHVPNIPLGAEVSAVNSKGSGLVVNTQVKRLFNGADYPSTTTQFAQRTIFAGSQKHPLKIWFTNSGHRDLMMYHLPTRDDDRIEVECVSNDADRIRHVIGLQSLVVLTGSAEMRVYTQNSDALTPSSVAVKTISNIGANDVQPVVCSTNVIFCGNRGGHVYALNYVATNGTYSPSDICIRAPHLFDGKKIVDMALLKSPIQSILCVSSDGNMYCCTFYADQQIVAWSQVVTNYGKFENVTVVSEDGDDYAYVVVNRNGRRYVERLQQLNVPTDKYKYRYLDSYLEGNFSEKTLVVSGLNHLEGLEVAVYGDGKVQSKKIVQNGKITLDEPCNEIAVGLPIDCELKTLPVITQSSSQLQGFVKNVAEITMRVSYDGDIFSNNSTANRLYKVKLNDIYMGKFDERSKVVRVTTDGSWEHDASVIIKHNNCLPLEIQAITSNLAIEDYSGSK